MQSCADIMDMDMNLMRPILNVDREPGTGIFLFCFLLRFKYFSVSDRLRRQDRHQIPVFAKFSFFLPGFELKWPTPRMRVRLKDAARCTGRGKVVELPYFTPVCE